MQSAKNFIASSIKDRKGKEEAKENCDGLEGQSKDDWLVISKDQDKTPEELKEESVEPVESELTMPDPERAPNDIIRKLLSNKDIEKSLPGKTKDQALKLLNILCDKVIKKSKLQHVAFNGIPDEFKGLRPIIWRLLLNYLPLETHAWDDHLTKSKAIYDAWKDELIIKPKIKEEEEARETQQMLIDHPLSVNNNSKWNKFFKDQDLWDEIEKDVKRTRTDMSFFYKAVDPALNNNLEQLMKQAESKRADFTLEIKQKYIETHSDVLGRILFIYAKLNPGIKYVQGMNEILAVLYYSFQQFGDENMINKDYLESDLFFCFSNLMMEIRDGFIRDLDKEQSGINGRVKAFSDLLKEIDNEVYRNLQNESVHHQFYALRWVMLLMCQEFDMSNVIRLWDTLFSDPDRFEFLNYVCIACVKLKREYLVDGDFSQCMQELQAATDLVNDVKDIISAAVQIQAEYLQFKTQQQEWQHLSYLSLKKGPVNKKKQ